MTANRPPLRARLHWYNLTSDELALLQAMVEHCSDGSTIWAAIPRLAAYSKVCDRTVQRLVHRFCLVGVLTQLAPANTTKRRPATYRFNEEALQLDPRMAPYINRQQEIPGIRRPPVPGEAIPDRHLVSTGHQSGDCRTPVLVTAGHQSGDCVSPDSKAFDSRTIDSRTMIQLGAPVCQRCGGSGMRGSNFKPGKFVICECTERA